MRLFRRGNDTKTSVLRREAVTSTAEAASVPVAPASRPSSRHPVAPVAGPSPSRRPTLIATAAPVSQPAYERYDDSDVFVVDDDSPTPLPIAHPASAEVTLFVHGWYNVEPGPLSWTFPNLRAALDAVQRMKNAIGWCVVSGTEWPDLDAARSGGAILVEQLS
jgi:hypothetical protein